MMKLIALLTCISTVYGASDIFGCDCQGFGVFGSGGKALQVSGYQWESNYHFCEKVCLTAKYTAMSQRRAGRQRRQAFDGQLGAPINAGFVQGPCGPSGCGGPCGANPCAAPNPPPEVPGYRHAINYNCIEQCAAPQFQAPLCHFECSRHGQFLDTISVAAPPRAVVTSPIIPPPPPPRQVAIPPSQYGEYGGIGAPYAGPYAGLDGGEGPYFGQQYAAAVAEPGPLVAGGPPPYYGAPYGNAGPWGDDGAGWQRK